MFVFLLYLRAARIACVLSLSTPFVRAPSGRYEGVHTVGNLGVSYESFLGIPYAKPPVNELRFANPEPLVVNPSAYHRVRVAKPDCIQKNLLLLNPTVTGVEDCLYLNVYRPLSTTSRSRLPVIVFIYGGAFFSGSASPSALGPQYFMNTGKVIFLAMAYRLGAMGFLSTGDSNCPGNFGLKDQRMALRWVRDNIQSFGGDPDNVTLMGVSSGGVSAQMHMMSPLSDGLFHRCVSMSGNAIAQFNIPTPDPLSLAIKQAELLNITYDNNSAHLVDNLRRKSAYDIVNSVNGLKFWSIDPPITYRPVVEPNAPEAFLTELPSEISRNGNYNHLPWIQGVVDNDGGVRTSVILSNKTLLAELSSRLNELLPKILEVVPNAKYSPEELAVTIRRQYLDGKHVIDDSNKDGFIKVYTDLWFRYSMYKSIVDFVRTAPCIEQTPVYLYQFSYKGPLSYSMTLTGTNTDFGVVHLDDTLYLFQTVGIPPFAVNSTEAQVTRILVNYYVDFVVTGKPTSSGKLKTCDAYTLLTDAFCDYTHFVNSKSLVTIDNYFDLPMLYFWDDILE